MDRNQASTQNPLSPIQLRFPVIGDHYLLSYQSTIEIATTKKAAGVIL